MKKTSKALMGITALVVAFSACALTACNSQPDDGSIKGNYQEATAEEIAQTLNGVNEQTLFGDTTAAGYKFGLDVSSKLDVSSYSGEILTETLALSAGYKLLITGNESAFDYKGAGNFAMSYEDKSADDNANSELGDYSNIKLDMYQDNAMLYASLTLSQTEDDASASKFKIKLDCASIAQSLLPGDGMTGEEITVPSLPEDVTTPDLSSLDLVTAINMLNQMGATTSMDTSNGIKLKISVTEDTITSIIASETGASATELDDVITFNKCNLDFYLAIDKDGAFSAASVVVDVDFTINVSSDSSSTVYANVIVPSITMKLNGNVSIKADPNVKPEIPANIASDISYMDMTDMFLLNIESILGQGMLG
ncbi:MAG: hypothetical protein ACI4MC_00385 [Candidatus Coproplasma sp.]